MDVLGLDLRPLALAASLLGGFACGPSLPSGEGSSDGGMGEGTTTTGGSSGAPTGSGMVPADDTSTSTSSSSSDGGLTFADTEDIGGCGFLCPPDATHPEAQCDPVVQDCAEGQKCVWYTFAEGEQRRDAARCIPVTGDGQPFEPCTLPTGIGPAITDDCGPESYCLEVYGTADHGYCAPFVDGPRFDCSAYPGTTAAVENGSTFPAACLYYDCHPLVEGGCPEGMQCTFYPASLYGTNTCWLVPPEADLPLGAECDFGECGEGELCVPAEWAPDCAGERCCTEWCDLNAPQCTNPDAACEPFPVWNQEGDPSFEWLGACLVPGSIE